MQKDLEFLTFIFALSYDDSFIEEKSEINLIAFQLLKIEAIHISLFIDVSDVFSAMSRSLSASLRFKILRFLLLH